MLLLLGDEVLKESRRLEETSMVAGWRGVEGGGDKEDGEEQAWKQRARVWCFSQFLMSYIQALSRTSNALHVCGVRGTCAHVRMARVVQSHRKTE